MRHPVFREVTHFFLVPYLIFFSHSEVEVYKLQNCIQYWYEITVFGKKIKIPFNMSTDQDFNSLDKIKILEKNITKKEKPDFIVWKDPKKEKEKKKEYQNSDEAFVKLHNESETNLYGIHYFSIRKARNKNCELDFTTLALDKIKAINQDKFFDVHFVRNKGSHLSPLFMLKGDDLSSFNIKYVIFSSIATDILHPYVEMKSIKENEEKNENYCEAFFPIINQNQKTADNMELIRDIIYSFFYYHKIKIIIQKAKFIVKDENLKERDAILTVGLSPFIRFPGLAASTSKDPDNIECHLNYYSTKLNLSDKEYIEKEFEINAPGKSNKASCCDLPKGYVTSVENNKPSQMKSTSLIFDSKIRQMKTFGLSFSPTFGFAVYRHKIGFDLLKTFNYILAFEQDQENFEVLKNLPVSKIVSFVDAGQRDSIMDISNFISSSFFYDSNPGSSLCSYQKNENNHILYFTFRTADRDSMLANANTIAAALRISDIIVIPVNYPPFYFFQCFEYAITRIDLLVSASDFKSNELKKKIYLQFPNSISEGQAKYFHHLFKKTLNNLGLYDTKSDFFIGSDDNAKDSINEIKESKSKSKESKSKSKNKKSKNVSQQIKKEKNMQIIIDALTAFSAVNDYREYMKMNIFFPKDHIGEYKSFIFESDK